MLKPSSQSQPVSLPILAQEEEHPENLVDRLEDVPKD